MTVDRGGLVYEIRVENRFGASLREFRNQISAARRSFRAFRDEARALSRDSSSAATNMNRLARATRSLADAQRRANSQAARRRTSLAAERRATQAAADEAERLRQSQAGRTSSFRAEAAAVTRLADAYERLATARRAAGGATQLIGAGGAAPPGGGAARQFTDLSTATDKAERSGSRFLFTFRRLFGVLAAFTAARVAAQGIGNLVSQTVEFNRALESANLGIAALVSASGGVSDALGSAVGASERLALAQREAARQTQLLRRDGLRTAATFEQLVDTFQIAVGPGLDAGLTLDQVRRLTVQISQAAAAAGVAQNQLSEEIRSILSGTIQQRTTRLAAVLGITNEDIRNTKQAGVLVEFLNEKFSAFGQAGKVALGTFDALISNTLDGINQLLGAGGLEFFNEIKAVLQDTINLVAQADPVTGVLQPNPRGVAIVRALTDGLRRAVAEARRLGAALGFDDLDQSAALIGNTVGTTAEFVGRLIEGFVRGAQDLAAIFSRILTELREATGLELFDGEAVTLLARVATLIVGIRLAITASSVAWAALRGAVVLTVAPLRTITALMAAINLSAVASLAPFLAIAGVLTLTVALFEQLAQKITGVELSLGSIARLVANEFTSLGPTIANAFNDIAGRVSSNLRIIGLRLKLTFTEVINFLNQRARQLQAALPGGSGRTVLASLQAADAQEEASLRRRIQQEEERLRVLVRQTAERRRQLDADRRSGISRIVRENTSTAQVLGAGFRAVVKESGQALNGIVTGLREVVATGTGRPAKDFADLNAVLNDLAPTLNRQRESLLQQSKLSKELTRETLRSQTALEQQQRTQGLLGEIQAQRLSVVRATQQLRQRSVALGREEETAQRQLAALGQRREQSERRLAALGVVSRATFTNALDVSQQLLQATAARSRLQDRIRVQELAITRARSAGTDPAAGTEARLGQLRREVASLDQRIEQLRGAASGAFAGVSAEQARVLGRLVGDRLRLLGQERAIQEQIRSIQSDRNRLEQQSLDNLARQLQRQAEIALQRRDPVEIEVRARVAEDQARALRGARGGDAAGDFQIRLQAAQGALAIERQRVTTQERANAAQQRGLRLTLSELITREALLRVSSIGIEGSQQALRNQRSLAAVQNARFRVEQQLAQVIRLQAAESRQSAAQLEIARARVTRVRQAEQERLRVERERAALATRRERERAAAARRRDEERRAAVSVRDLEQEARSLLQIQRSAQRITEGFDSTLPQQAEALRQRAELLRSVSLGGGASVADLAAQRARQQAELEQARLQVLERQNSAKERALRLTVAELAAKEQELRVTFSTAATERERQAASAALRQATLSRLAVQQQLLVSQRASAAEVAKGTAQLQIARQEAERLANLSGKNGFFAGLGQEAADALARLPTAFATTFQIIQGIAQQFASFVSNLIVDAFDPTKDIDIRERFARLLQGIARLIIQTLVQIAVVAAITAALISLIPGFGGAAAGASGAGGLGVALGRTLAFEEGGSVPGGSAMVPSSSLPPGVPSGDRVPAFLTPGEHVIRRSSAAKYGHGVMEKINQGLVDPTALQALAGTVRSTTLRSKASRGGGYQLGGQVAAARAAGSQLETTSAGQPSAVTPAIVQADDQSMERLLKGGRGAFLNFLRTNSSAVKGALR